MGIQINGNTNNINAGIGSLSIEDINELDIVGVATAANFKTGVSNLHSLGLTLSGGQLDVGSNIKLGTAGVVTATSFVGSGANLTGITQTTINNNGSNRIITGSSTANTLEGEATFTYDGTSIATIDTSQTYATFRLDGNAGGAIEFYENGTRRFEIYGTDPEVALYDRDKGAYHTRFKSGGNVEISDGKLSIKGADTATGSGGPAALEIKQGDANNEFVNLALQTGSGGPLAVISAIADATGVYPNTTGQLTFNTQVGGGVFERMRISSAGLVGISTDAPSAAWLDIATGSGSYDHIRFRRLSSDSNIASNWSMKPYAGHLYFREGGSTDKIQFMNGGDLNIMDGNLRVASGHGIDFSANGNAAGMTSELLDIYEEGSWTPYIYPMSSNIPVTYSHQSGRYTRIGNVVHFQFKLQVSNITGNRNQGFGINGFPFNNTGSQDYQTTGQFFGVSWSGEMPTTLVFTPNTNRGVCYFFNSSQHYQASSMLDINVSNSMLSGSGHYFTHV